ncbi:hypothetical protein BWI97_13880 [Siphonobacter sp. BAB-5405]|uniref:LysM peptidoglycan-binding domain-containing protein n=1 Tax=Siphonobacter sp. BAB-5405 TaxID=1864825 RepID=UPI000C7F8570|nr:LysM peptidoglycan-binding domain-containing protein [Siphonobacter sp. BAB-5405]PMD95685.1 hypothetical protein BWI97_13880 [Siphonobacter sp. BAB-5405]
MAEDKDFNRQKESNEEGRSFMDDLYDFTLKLTKITRLLSGSFLGFAFAVGIGLIVLKLSFNYPALPKVTGIEKDTSQNEQKEEEEHVDNTPRSRSPTKASKIPNNRNLSKANDSEERHPYLIIIQSEEDQFKENVQGSKYQSEVFEDENGKPILYSEYIIRNDSIVHRRKPIQTDTIVCYKKKALSEPTKTSRSVNRSNLKVVHTVGPRDILSVVAKKYNVTLKNLMRANGKTRNYVKKGENLIIPLTESQMRSL